MRKQRKPTTPAEREKVYRDHQLVYAATSRCPCGAGLAYPRGIGIRGSWDCSDILTGRAIPSGQTGAVMHTDRLPFTFWEVRSEQQPSANGATTRPRETPRARQYREVSVWLHRLYSRLAYAVRR